MSPDYGTPAAQKLAIKLIGFKQWARLVRKYTRAVSKDSYPTYLFSSYERRIRTKIARRVFRQRLFLHRNQAGIVLHDGTDESVWLYLCFSSTKTQMPLADAIIAFTSSILSHLAERNGVRCLHRF